MFSLKSMTKLEDLTVFNKYFCNRLGNFNPWDPESSKKPRKYAIGKGV